MFPCAIQSVRNASKLMMVTILTDIHISNSSSVFGETVSISARNGYPGTRVATRYPGTRSGPGYPEIFITRLLSTQHNRLDCKFGVFNNIIS